MKSKKTRFARVLVVLIKNQVAQMQPGKHYFCYLVVASSCQGSKEAAALSPSFYCCDGFV
jgi:hypothetical protein